MDTVPVFTPAGVTGANRMVKVVVPPLDATEVLGCDVHENPVPVTVMGVVIVKAAVLPTALLTVNIAS